RFCPDPDSAKQSDSKGFSVGFDIGVQTMLPGFRLIAVSFLVGFVVMFVGLRVVASLNNIHEGLPLMAAQAAAIPHPGMIEPRGTSLSMPVLYDLRFVGSPNAPMLVNVTPEAIERLLPARAAIAEDPATTTPG